MRRVRALENLAKEEQPKMSDENDRTEELLARHDGCPETICYVNDGDECETAERIREEIKANTPAEQEGHIYPGGEDFTSDCSNGCGAWMGPTRSGGPKGIDPFGSCPKAPPPPPETCFNCGRGGTLTAIGALLDANTKKPINECDECHHARTSPWSAIRERLNREGRA